jgi:hypothetical protein
MSRLSLSAAVLLLSSAWTIALSAAPRTDQNPNSIGPTRTIEGCLSTLNDDFVLTTANGKTYQLTGDIAQLTARVGNRVRLLGHADDAVDAELTVAGGPHSAFGVDKIESLSASCK